MNAVGTSESLFALVSGHMCCATPTLNFLAVGSVRSWWSTPFWTCVSRAAVRRSAPQSAFSCFIELEGDRTHDGWRQSHGIVYFVVFFPNQVP